MHQPTRPPIHRPPPRHGRRGCVADTLIAVLALFACTLVSCGSLLMAYLVVPVQPVSVLIMGIDARDGEGLATRSDAVMIAGVKGVRLNVMSIPRDVFIRVPGYGSPQRINTVNALGEIDSIGGGRLLQDSIEHSFGVRPSAYIRLDFDAFQRMIDAVGGVTVDVPFAIQDNAYPTDDGGTMTVRFEAGRQHMNGERALIYARTRNPDDDYRRAGRQQQILTAFARKAALPIFWPGLLVVIAGSVDTNLSPVDALRVLPAAMIGLFNSERFVMDRDYVVAGAGGVVPDYARVNPIFWQMFGR
ncbi:MAG: LytR family transcriptional regulator [Anaerolineaceae bacterium]|nr:MAG: LytR family transcriptional regulator [Anaerolineaceae bacterium]